MATSKKQITIAKDAEINHVQPKRDSLRVRKGNWAEEVNQEMILERMELEENEVFNTKLEAMGPMKNVWADKVGRDLFGQNRPPQNEVKLNYVASEEEVIHLEPNDVVSEMKY
ncbi:hypothetical protein Ancab_021278 [Ancistrocladus abbreviatus]